MEGATPEVDLREGVRPDADELAEQVTSDEATITR
jgi:hypothetical protein